MDARTLPRELLPMTDDEFRGAFKGSPMKPAKLRAVKRNAAVGLGNAGTPDGMRARSETASTPDPEGAMM